MRSRSSRNLQAHELINKLSVIIGNCDLLSEMLEPGTEQARRAAVIRVTADEAVKELTKDFRKVGVEIHNDLIASHPRISELLLAPRIAPTDKRRRKR